VSCEKVFVVKTNPLENGVAMRRIEVCTCVAAIATRMANAMAPGRWSRDIVRREAHGSAGWPTSVRWMRQGVWNRSKPRTQDGRALRRYRRRWKVERTLAWLGNFRQLVVRYDRSITIYEALFHIACFMITLRRVLKRALDKRHSAQPSSVKHSLLRVPNGKHKRHRINGRGSEAMPLIKPLGIFGNCMN